MILQLQTPTVAMAPSFMDMIQEMSLQGEKTWEGYLPHASEGADAFVQRLVRNETDPKPGLIAESTSWAVADGQVVGRISLRHALNENLREFGGHIGYEVRPSSRRRGFAKEMLRQILQTPKALEIGRLLLTCAPDNAASIRTIVSNGGLFEKTAFVARWNRQTNYYWIDLSRRPLPAP